MVGIETRYGRKKENFRHNSEHISYPNYHKIHNGSKGWELNKMKF
jgi:hypothetical protein